MVQAVKYSVLYAFTVTLLPRIYKKEPEVQFYETSELLRDKLKIVSNNRLTLVGEITKNYNIHYHGFIQFPIVARQDNMKFFHKLFRTDKVFGFVQIKQCTDDHGWQEYISKDIHRTSEVLPGIKPIICDSLMYFTEEQRMLYSREF